MDTDNADNGRIGSRLIVAGLCFASVLLLWVLVYSHLTDAQTRLVDSAKMQTHHLADHMQLMTADAIGNADGYIRSVRRSYNHYGGIDGARHFMQDVQPNLRVLAHVSIFGPDGRLMLKWNGVEQPPGGARDTVFASPAFQFQMADDGDTVFVSTAAMDADKGVETIQVVRRLTDAEGWFAGILSAAVRVEPLVHDLVHAINGEHYTATIADNDGRIIVRRVGAGTDRSTAQDFVQATANAIAYDFDVTVDIPTSVVTRALDKERNWIYAFATAVSLLIIVAGYVIARHVNQADAERARREDARRLEETRSWEQRILNMLDDMPVGISIVSPGPLKWLYVNQSLVDMFGASSKAELMSIPIGNTFARPDEMHAMLANRHEALGPPKEIERVRLDGSPWWSLVQRQTYELDGEECLLISYHDITAKKTAEASIALAQQDYQEIFENATQGISVTTEDGRYVRVNESFARMLGFDSPQQIIEEVTDIGHDIWVDRNERQKMVEQLRADGRVDLECLLRRRDGMRIWVSMSLWGRWNADGELEHLESIVEDISNRKETEMALTSAMEMADSANRAKSDFLSLVSHELRTPLNAILGFGQILLKSGKANLTERQTAAAGQIIHSGKLLLSLIEDILDLSKIESGKLTLTSERIGVALAVAEATALVEDFASERRIRIDATGIDPSAVVMADAKRLRQIVLNLMSNAIKYNAGGGLVTISTQKVKDRALRVSITDSGIGIPAELGDDVFAPFSRFVATNTDIEGSGIGLTVCRNLIELMNGSIGYHSIEGAGSTFWIELPVPEDLARQQFEKDDSDANARPLSGFVRM